jgi:hypothetical protein
MYPAIPSIPAHLLVVAALSLVSVGGCNLHLDVDQYPYQNRSDTALFEDARDDTSTDVSDTDVPDSSTDAAIDASDSSEHDISDSSDAGDTQTPTGKPFLIFTELMPDSSTPPEIGTEYGEYIEVKNIGTAPADPRRIFIQLSGSDRRIKVDPFPSGDVEQEVFDGLQLIEPGDYFVFVRQDDPHYNLTTRLDDGTYYEYGRWFDDVPLSNSSRRLQLSYRASEFDLIHHDAVEWAVNSLIDPTGTSNVTLNIREDVAWGVRPDFEDASANDDPAHWCFHIAPLIASPVKASPGQPTPANCVGEEE